jgi:hypothetical protein
MLMLVLHGTKNNDTLNSHQKEKENLKIIIDDLTIVMMLLKKRWSKTKDECS